MNELVNLGKRGVELPAGCKDLIDVLQQAKRHSASSTLTVSSAEALTDVAKHVLRLVELGAKSKYLVITWHEMMNYVQFMNQGEVVTALVVVHENTHREQAVRGVFSAAGLAPTLDEAAAGWSVRVLGYPLPDAAAAIEELISDLLRTGYGLAENVRLEFGYWESDAS
jgi:hypothetical protein